MEEGSRRGLSNQPAAWLPAPETASAQRLAAPGDAADSSGCRSESPHAQQRAVPDALGGCDGSGLRLPTSRHTDAAASEAASLNSPPPEATQAERHTVAGEAARSLDSQGRAPLVVFGRSITLGSAVPVRCAWACSPVCGL